MQCISRIRFALRHTIIVSAATICISMPVLSQTKDEQDELPPSPPPRPSLIFDLSWMKETSNDYYAKTSLTSFNKAKNAMNNIRFESMRVNTKGIPSTLYRTGDVFSFENNDYFMMLMAGSASDKLFHDKESLDIFTAAGISFYNSGSHKIIAGLFYSKENVLPYRYNFPIPIVSYRYKTEAVIISVGIPSMLLWNINKTFAFNFVYMPSTNIDSSLTMRPLPFISIGPVFEWKTNRYAPEEMRPHNHKLYHEYIHLKFKVQSFVGKNVAIYISAGYSFRDRFYDGNDSYDHNNTVNRKHSYLIQLGMQLYRY